MDQRTSVRVSTFPSARPFICPFVHPCAIFSCEEMAKKNQKKKKQTQKNKSKRQTRRRAGCLEQSTASSLWHKSLLWSLKHNKARVPPTQHPLSYTPGPDSKIIPIMQHVCDCRNPLWPFWSSLRRTVPETWCQAASDGTLPTPNPQHTRWPRFPSFSPPSRTAWGVFSFFVPSFDTDVSRWCRA